MTVPRVLMVARLVPPAYSGAGLQAATLANALRNRGVDVTMIATDRTCRWPRRDRLGDVPLLRRPTYGARGRLEKAVLWVSVAVHLLARPRRYGIVHLHGAAHVLRLLRLLKPALGFCVVYKPTLAGMDDAIAIRSAHGQSLLDVVDWWTCVASSLSAAAESAGVPIGRIASIPNGIDLVRYRVPTRLERRSARLDLDISETARVWVSLGAICARKRQHLLLEAWERLAVPRPLLLLVGPEGVEERDVAYAAGLRTRIRDGGLPADVRLVSEQRDAVRILAAADGFVLASEAEGLPNAALEALASGLPIVCTPFAGSSDLQRLGGERVHIASASAESLASVIAEVPLAPRQVPRLILELDIARVAADYHSLYGQSRIAPNSHLAEPSHV